MTSQRDETTHAPAREEMTDDPIIIERRDESLTSDSPEGDGPADGIPAGDGVAEDQTASDELIGRHAAPGTGGADPASLVAPPDEPAADTGVSHAARPATGTGITAPGSAVAGSEGAGSEVPGSAVPGPAAAPGVPAAALSEQQWPAIQAMFVDDPKESVRRAAAAAEEVAKALVASLQREQAALRASWENGGDTTTEDLRTALQQYRAFCGRLEGLA